MDTYTWVNTTWITLQSLTAIEVKPLPKITGLELSLKVQKQIKSEYRGIKFATGRSSQTLEIKLLATMTKRRIQ